MLGAFLLALALAARRSGLVEEAGVVTIRDAVRWAGPWGIAAYVLAFAAGQLVYLPGMLFVVVAFGLWGKVAGLCIALLGALVSVNVSFLVARALGGRALAQLRWAWAQRWLERTSQRPVRTVALLRSVLWMSPPLSYALGLSPIGWRAHALGSLLGLIAPLTAAALLFEWLVQ